MSHHLGGRKTETYFYAFLKILCFETLHNHSIKHENLNKYSSYGLSKVLHKSVSFGQIMVLNFEIDATAMCGYRVTLVMRKRTVVSLAKIRD